LFTLLVVILGCGGGGGGGESFLVSGLWTTAATGPGTASPNSAVCNAAAAGAGTLGSTQLNVVQAGNTVTANEVGSSLAFTGTVNSSNQSFTLNSTTPICQQQGACQLCGAAGVDFLNAAGNTADVNVTFGLSGNSACPVQCTVAFPTTTATRS
jgi:hypothetical protein